MLEKAELCAQALTSSGMEKEQSGSTCQWCHQRGMRLWEGGSVGRMVWRAMGCAVCEPPSAHRWPQRTPMHTRASDSSSGGGRGVPGCVGRSSVNESI